MHKLFKNSISALRCISFFHGGVLNKELGNDYLLEKAY